MNKRLREMTQAEVYSLTPRQAETAVKAICPHARVEFVTSVEYRSGYMVRGAHTRVGIGFCRTQGQAWKEAASQLWQVIQFYPEEIGR